MNQFFRLMVMALAPAVVGYVAARTIVLGRRTFSRDVLPRELMRLALICYIICVAILVILPLPMTRYQTAASVPNNYIPFVETLSFLREAAAKPDLIIGHGTANIFGNILMFVPAGIFLPWFLPRMRKARRTILTAMAISICIELAQLVSRHLGVVRAVDIDDVIMNTIGAGIGYAIYRFSPALRSSGTASTR